MDVYTIGFTKKSAKHFFELLKKNNISCILDIRLKNNSQLAGFAKGRDLDYFSNVLLGIEYIHDIRFSPTQELLEAYKKGDVTWLDYENRFNEIMRSRGIVDIIEKEYLNKLDGICLLCSEEKADQCHRRLVAEFLENNLVNVMLKITHL